MKNDVEKLFRIANSQSRRIIGLMSGTSLDGLDIAVCNITGSGINTNLVVEQFATIPFTDDFRDAIRTIFAKRQIDFQQLCILNPFIGTTHANLILECLQNWNIKPEQIDLIASHGQTVFHAPQKQHQLSGYPNATLQIGDGDHIAVGTGIITLSDFRQKHIAAGGEGAPLAVYGDYFLFSKQNENRMLLNMGGIANFTYLPGDPDSSKVFTTDTGPGNTLIDAFTKKYFQKAFDENGAIASSGRIHHALLNALKENPFFDQKLPKTTGPEVFNIHFVEQVAESLGSTISLEDLLATLTQFSADTICDCIKQTGHADFQLYASGGGAHNPVLMQAIEANLGQPVRKIDELGVSGDSKEAVLFAVLANEAICGVHSYFGQKEGVPVISMGKVSFPH